MADRTIKVDYLARVEGEGALYVKIKGRRVDEVRLQIFEPPRFFEALLRGRHFTEAPDITARICGICPVAYQMSAVHAMESALGVKVEGPLRVLRRLLYCGEWIESHVLHIFMLQGPDLTGHESALSLAAVAPEVVKTALHMKKIGNQLLKVIGGRSVHPVNACAGGFYSWPAAAELKALVPELEWGLEQAIAAVKWAKALPYPQLDVDYEFVAMHRTDEYAILDGKILSSQRGHLDEDDFENHYLERHERRSNALHSYTAEGKPYLVGPLARLNLNQGFLGESASQVLHAPAGLPAFP